MDTSAHNFTALFDQLGLPSWEEAIERFVEEHRPLAEEIPLHEAIFWNDSQRKFLLDAIEEDSDWAEVVDHFDALLRH